MNLDLDTPAESTGQSIDLRELGSVLWAGKWRATAVTLVFTVAALVYSLLQPNVYEAEVLLAPAITEEPMGIGGLAGQLGGLASLAGISLGGSTTDKTTLALEVLQSRAFINDFVRNRGLLIPLMAAESWDIERSTWVIDPDVYDVDRSRWVRRVSPPRKPEPSELEVFKEFTKNVLNVSRDEKSGMVTVKLRSLSPIAAQEWLTNLISDLNKYIRDMDVEDARQSIAYLEAQIEKTSVREMQAVFYSLVEQQTRTMMLAEVREEYVFKTVDPAIVPDEKAGPKRVLICVLGVLAGAMLGTLYVLVRHLSRTARPTS